MFTDPDQTCGLGCGQAVRRVIHISDTISGQFGDRQSPDIDIIGQ
jgi:hypothetical protein